MFLSGNAEKSVIEDSDSKNKVNQGIILFTEVVN